MPKNEKNAPKLDPEIGIPDWHRQIVTERLAEYRAGTAGDVRNWTEIQKDLKARLAGIRPQKAVMTTRAAERKP